MWLALPARVVQTWRCVRICWCDCALPVSHCEESGVVAEWCVESPIVSRESHCITASELAAPAHGSWWHCAPARCPSRRSFDPPSPRSPPHPVITVASTGFNQRTTAAALQHTAPHRCRHSATHQAISLLTVETGPKTGSSRSLLVRAAAAAVRRLDQQNSHAQISFGEIYPMPPVFYLYECLSENVFLESETASKTNF